MTSLPKWLKSIFTLNPIIVKEIRSRMRGPRAFVTLTLILLAMGGVMYGMLQIILASSRYTNVLSPQIGQGLFAALAFLELFMICAVTPAVTAGAISSEKERQTYEMLMATPLSPVSILWGKLISALSYVFLLLFAAVPLASVVFIFGGVTLDTMLKALLVLLGIAVAYGILGLFMSALFGRTGRATVAGFVAVVVLMIGPLFLAALVGVLTSATPPRWILAPSPISALSAAMASTMGSAAGGDVFNVLGGIFNMGVQPVSQTSIPRPLYHYTVPFYALLSTLLYMLSTRLVQPTRRWRLRWEEWAIGLGTLVILIGLTVGGYFATARRYEWAVNPNSDQTTQAIIAPGFPNGAMIQKQAIIAAQAVPVLAATPTPAPTATAAAPAAGYPVTGNTPAPTITPAQPAAIQPAGATPTANAAAGASPVKLDEDAQAEIYAAIARQLYTTDNTFGGKAPGWANVYLVSTTSDGVGDPNEPKGEPVKFSKTILSGVATRLNDLPAKVMWIDSNKAAPMDATTGEVDKGKGVIFTFGNIYPQKDGTLHVSASLYFANLGAAGKTYILTKVDGVWKVTGKTGVEWIS